MRALLPGLLLTFIGGSVLADDVIVGDPTSCHLKIEYEATEQMLHLRPISPTGAHCQITQLMVQAALYQAFDQRRGDPELKLIFLGRLADYYWLPNKVLMSAVDDSGPQGGWDRVTGHARGTNDNAYVAAVVEKMFSFFNDGTDHYSEDQRMFTNVLWEHGYTVVGVSVEKVLVDETEFFGEPAIPRGRYPCDALVHLRIKKVF